MDAAAPVTAPRKPRLVDVYTIRMRVGTDPKKRDWADSKVLYSGTLQYSENRASPLLERDTVFALFDSSLMDGKKKKKKEKKRRGADEVHVNTLFARVPSRG